MHLDRVELLRLLCSASVQCRRNSHRILQSGQPKGSLHVTKYVEFSGNKAMSLHRGRIPRLLCKGTRYHPNKCNVSHVS